MAKDYYVYMMTNKSKTVLYTGVTNNLTRRVYEHKNRLTQGFTTRYGVDRLVYYEVYDNVEYALTREKQIKAGPRRKKDELISSFNVEWQDLSDEL